MEKLIQVGNRIINPSYVISYTYTPSKGKGESSLALMLSITQGDGAQVIHTIRGEQADQTWEKLSKETYTWHAIS